MYARNYRLVNKQDWILNFAEGKRVLDVGCAGALAYNTSFLPRTLHYKLSSKASSLVGIDLNKDAITFLREQFPANSYLACNAEELYTCDLGEKFEVVVLGDIIEHVPQPASLLQGVRKQLQHDGVCLITTANAFAITAMLKYILGHEPTHPDHVAYYSRKTLARLLSHCQFDPFDWAFYKIEELGKMNYNLMITSFIERFACILQSGLAVGLCCAARPTSV